jgi:hypothetical protein
MNDKKFFSIVKSQPSGFTFNYTSPSGLNLPTAWIEIVGIHYYPYANVTINFSIYKDELSYNNGLPAIFPGNQVQVTVFQTEWASYFDPDVMDQLNHNILKQCINYLLVTL